MVWCGVCQRDNRRIKGVEYLPSIIPGLKVITNLCAIFLFFFSFFFFFHPVAKAGITWNVVGTWTNVQ